MNSTVTFEHEISSLGLVSSPVARSYRRKGETATTEITSLVVKIIKPPSERFTNDISTVRAREETMANLRLLFSYFLYSLERNIYLSDEIKIKTLLDNQINISWIETIEKSYPEVIELSNKLKSNEKLTRIDKWNLNEIVEASGWNKEDIVEDLKNLDVDPSEREERYWNLFKKYYIESKKLKDVGDNTQAAEKLWGSITALIKAYAANKGMIIEHWSRGKLDRFVANNVGGHLKEKFEDLLTYGSELHEHFYEGRLPQEKFEKRWNQCVELIEEIKRYIKED